MIRPRNESLEAMRKRVSESIQADRDRLFWRNTLIRDDEHSMMWLAKLFAVLLLTYFSVMLYLFCN